jgi:hypothetical protein
MKLLINSPKSIVRDFLLAYAESNNEVVLLNDFNVRRVH